MNISPSAVVTFEELEGFRVVGVLGRVSARAARPRNRLRDAMVGFRALVGLQSFEFLSEAERARRESLAILLERAQALGAHAVIGLRFRIARARDGGTQVIAVGRAVLLDAISPDDEGTTP